jgi:hypothetical protein
MPDYQQGKIYRLVSNKTEDVYYGATTRTLTHRKNHHKSYLDCSSKKLFENDGAQLLNNEAEYLFNKVHRYEYRLNYNDKNNI